MTQEESVPIEELQALVEIWRGMSKHQNTPKHNATTLKWCSDELQAVIEDYE